MKIQLQRLKVNITTDGFWTAVFAGILMTWMLGDVLTNHEIKNPRAMHGKDTLYTRDTGYVIRFVIEKTFVPVKEYDGE